VRSAQDPAPVEAEQARLVWLANRFPVPEIVAVDGCWLVTTVPPGHPGNAADEAPDPGDVSRAIGAGLRRLHELPVADCPFERSWGTIVAQLQRGVEGDLVDASSLPQPYSRYEAGRLLELVQSGRPSPPDDPVVCHGSPAVTNLFVDGGALSGVVGVHRLGVADRHLDLAIVHRSISDLLGPQALYGFYEGYGQDPDLVRLDHYLLVDLLVSALHRSDPRP
jgi:aminoglycoside phosphotransferase